MASQPVDSCFGALAGQCMVLHMFTPLLTCRLICLFGPATPVRYPSHRSRRNALQPPPRLEHASGPSLFPDRPSFSAFCVSSSWDPGGAACVHHPFFISFRLTRLLSVSLYSRHRISILSYCPSCLLHFPQAVTFCPNSSLIT